MGNCRCRLLQPLNSGAGEGNRTLVISLEGFCSTIELHPRISGQIRRSPGARTALPTVPPLPPRLPFVLGGGGRIRTYEGESRQIYSLIPLTAREPLQTKPAIIQFFPL